MDQAKLAELLRGPRGPVMREMQEAGEAVKREAVRTAPVHKPTAGERRQRRPGTLRDSIVKRTRDADTVEVGSTDEIALISNKGSHPHWINGRPRLAFFSVRHGRLIRPFKVFHRGTKGTNWLPKSLNVLKRRY
jgi:hypothetical protein